MEAHLQVWNTSSLLLENVNHYKRLLGKMIYFTVTRLDTIYLVSVLSQFIQKMLTSLLGMSSTNSRIHQASPKEMTYLSVTWSSPF